MVLCDRDTSLSAIQDLYDDYYAAYNDGNCVEMEMLSEEFLSEPLRAEY